jgi:hypothetical protein
LIDGGGEERRAIGGRILTSQNRVAVVVSARIIVYAGDVGVDTSGGRHASVICAEVEVIAFEGSIDGCVLASLLRIAEIVSAGVAIITVEGSV